MVADEVDYVVGVDTHRDEHVLAVVASPGGAVVAQGAVPANGRGYAQALRFAHRYAGGTRVWAIEGAGHYGAGLARHLSERDEAVLEAGRSPRNEQRLRGKDDQLDAVRAARAALASEPLALPRSGQQREALRLLLVARRSAVDIRSEALVQLRSVIVTAPDALRDELRGLPVQRLLDRCNRLRRSSAAAPDELATRLVLRSLARRIVAATVEADELEREMRILAGETLQPRTHRLTRGRADPSPPALTTGQLNRLVGDLPAVHIKRTYDLHRDLLELLGLDRPACSNTLLPRRPHHMSSMRGRRLQLRSGREVTAPRDGVPNRLMARNPARSRHTGDGVTAVTARRQRATAQQATPRAERKKARSRHGAHAWRSPRWTVSSSSPA